MAIPTEHPDARAVFDEIAETMAAEDVTTAKFFGCLAQTKDGKAITCLFGDQMTFKLPDPATRQAALQLADVELWDPSGRNRPFKEWVAVALDHQDRWPELARQAAGISSAS